MGAEKTYVGITLGPIDRFLGCAKSTRSVWASSYLFAYIGKHLIKKYYEGGYRILKPQISDDMYSLHDGVGRFPDQYIFEASNDFDIKGLRQESDSILDKLTGNMVRVLNLNGNESKISDYLKQSLRIIIVKKNFSSAEDDSEVIKTMQNVLAEQECRDTFLSRESRNYLSDYFESKAPDMLLYVDAYSKECKGRLFDTIVECSAGDDYNGRKSDLIEGRLDNQLNPYQKYIAFVAADGDGFGGIMSKHKQSSLIIREYNNKVNELVRLYGGQVIYQGGDDILFYAPLFKVGKGKSIVEGKDILSLIVEIDKEFNAILKKHSWGENVNRPTISYGVSVSYFKFPMGEALEIAKDALEEAKTEGRNRISWIVRKHSGQIFRDVIDKTDIADRDTLKEDDEGISLIMKRITDFIHNSLGDNETFLHSVTHWLMEQEGVLSVILSKEEAQDCRRDDMLNNYIQNCFDEPVHKKYQAFFDAMKEYLLSFSGNQGIKKMHVLMRYVELLKKKKV